MTDIELIEKLEKINYEFLPLTHSKSDTIQDHFDQFLKLFKRELSDNSIGCILPVFFELTSWSEWSYSNYNYLKCLLALDGLDRIFTYQDKLGTNLKEHFSKTVVDDKSKGRKNILIELDKTITEIGCNKIGKSLYKFNFPESTHDKIIKGFNLTIKAKSSEIKQLKTIDSIPCDDILHMEEIVLPIIQKVKKPLKGFVKKIVGPVVTHSLYISEKYSLLYIFSHTVSKIKKDTHVWSAFGQNKYNLSLINKKLF